MMDEEELTELSRLAKLEFKNDPNNDFWKGYVQALTTALESEDNENIIKKIDNAIGVNQ